MLSEAAEANTAQRSDPYAQQVVQTFPKPARICLI